MGHGVIDRPLRRVHIVGGGGSGKTTLARWLSARLDAPMIELDVVAYEGGAGGPRSEEERSADLRDILARPAWVTEGVYLDWAEPLFREADVVIWLDLRWPVAARRIVIRHIRASLQRNNRHPGLANLRQFLGWSREYYLDERRDGELSRGATERFAAAHASRLFHCRHPRDVERFKSCVEGSPSHRDNPSWTPGPDSTRLDGC